jgi:iron complex outermembrane receptor protein
VNIGGRFEHYALNDYKEKKPVFRSGVNYELAKYSFLRASFGQGYRFPTISEAFISTSVGPLKIFPNPQLQSETGWNAELGFKQGVQYKGIKGFADVALFWTQYQDMMEFTFGQWSKDVSFQNGFGAGFKSLNTGETRIRGVEISTSGEATFNQVQCLFLLGYTYMDSKNLSPLDMIIRDSVGNALTFRSTSSDTNTDDVLKYRPKHLFKADMQFSWKRWEAGYSCRYASYMENIDAAFVSFPLNMFIRDIQKGRELNPNGAFVSDVRMGYKINKSFKINFLVLNLFNKEFMVRPADMQAPRSFSMQLIGKF